MERSEGQIRFARRDAALYVPIEIIVALIASNMAGDEEPCLPVTGNQYLLTGIFS